MKLCGMFLAAVILLVTVPLSHAQVVQINVARYGATGDSKTDDTAAFQQTLDELAKTGGTAMVPQGRYLIKGQLNIPNNVTLEGIWKAPNTGDSLQGSLLLAVAGAGEVAGTPFITLNQNSCVKGVTIYYPDQSADKPVPYPYTIASSGAENPSVIDCTLVNPYQAIDFGSKGGSRHNIQGVYGQPLFRGIYIDRCTEPGRIDNVQFSPSWMWEGKPALQQLQRDSGEAFIFGHTSWQKVSNTYCKGYKIGYHFIHVSEGGAFGSLWGIAADQCRFGVMVDDCASQGLLIANGQFSGSNNTDSAHVTVKATNTGSISLTNCSLWGGVGFNVRVAGKGSLMLSNCKLNWVTAKKAASIEVFGGDIIVNGCEFSGSNGPALSLRKGARSGIFSGKLVKGLIDVVNDSHVPLAESGNLTDSTLKH